MLHKIPKVLSIAKHLQIKAWRLNKAKMKFHLLLFYLLVILATLEAVFSQYTEKPSECQMVMGRDDCRQKLIEKNPDLAPAIVERVGGCYAVRIYWAKNDDFLRLIKV